MECYVDQEDTYPDDDEWINNDEPYQACYEEEGYDYENKPWYDEESYCTYVEVGPEEEGLEPKPPDPDQDPYSELNEYLSDSNYEDSRDEDIYEERNGGRSYGCSYQRSVETLNTYKKKSHHYGISSQQATYHSTQAMATKRTKKGSDYSFNPIVFTGYSQDPEEYLQWEAEMKYWFRLHNIPKEEKLSYALSMLDGKAYEWWLKEDAATYYTSEAVLDWGTLKARMYREFTRKYRAASTKVETPKPRPTHGPLSTSHAKGNVREAKAFSKSTHNSLSMEVLPSSKEKKPKPSHIVSQVTTKTSPTTSQQVLEPQGTLENGKTPNTLSFTEVICYRCQGSGHKAKECPARRLVAETHSAQKVNCAKISNDFVKSDFMIPTSCITHLSCVKGIDKSVGNQGELKGQDEQVHDKRNSKVDTYEPENTLVKEVDKSGQDVETEDEYIKEDVGNLEEAINCPEVGEIMETSDDQGPLVEPATFQDDNNSHNKCLATTEVCELKQVNRLYTDVGSFPLVHRFNSAELLKHTPCKSRRLKDEVEIDTTKQIHAPIASCEIMDTLVCGVQTGQLLLDNPWQPHQRVSELQNQSSRERDPGKNILYISSQDALNFLIRKEHMPLMIFRESLFTGQESNSLISVIKREHEGNDNRTKEDVHILPLTNSQSESIKVAPKLHELFGSTPTKSEVTSYVSNSLTLDILLQLLVYVKGLFEIEKPVSIIARTSCVESKLVMQWLNEVDSNYIKLLMRFYGLKDILMHLFLVLEVDYISGTQRRLEDSLGNELRPKKKQEIRKILTSARVRFKLLNSDFNLSMNPIMHLVLSLSIELGTGLIKKSNAQGNVKEEPPDHYPTHEGTSVPTNVTVWNAFFNFHFKNSMTVIMHLFLPWKAEQGTGLIKRKMRQGDIKEKPPDREAPKDARRLELESFPREHKDGSSNQCQDPMNVNDLARIDEDSQGVFQLKEEPPDLPNSESFRGKLLNPYTLQWTNLLYLCVGDQVLRSKLFEEGGYDEDMTSMDVDQLEPEETQPTVADNTLEGPTEAAHDLPYPKEDVSVQKEIKNDFKNSEINWRTFLVHLENHTKKNQQIISSDEEDMNLTSQVYSSQADLDLRALFGVQRSIQEDLSCKPTWNGILIHKGRFENWFHAKPRSHEGEINFSSQPDFNQSALNLHALFGEPRLNEKESSYQTNFIANITHQGRSGIWNYIKPSPYERVMEFTSQGSLHLPYLEALTFKTLHQRLFPYERPKELRISSNIIPRHSTFMPKLSRLKKISHFPYFGSSSSIHFITPPPTALIIIISSSSHLIKSPRNLPHNKASNGYFLI